MLNYKTLNKETITVDVKPGASLLVINKKKKLAANCSITFEGRNIIDIATENAKRINNEFMSLIKVYLTSLNPIKTIGKQCCETISKYSGLSLDEANVKLKSTLSDLNCPNIETMLKSLPFKLEAYEKQRLMFAMTFLIKPKLIIMDNTIFKVDTKIKPYLLKELKKLKEENHSSFIFISKDINDVCDVVDSIAVMYKGTVIEYGKKNLILKDPIHPYTRYMLVHNKVPGVTETSLELNDYVKNANSTPRCGCSFCLNCKKSSYDCIYLSPTVKTVNKDRKVICCN